jgi:hypothetical protein
MLLGKAALVMILVGVSAQAFSPPALGRIGLSPVVQKQVACACVLGFVVQQHVAVISMEQPGVLEEVHQNLMGALLLYMLLMPSSTASRLVKRSSSIE